MKLFFTLRVWPEVVKREKFHLDTLGVDFGQEPVSVDEHFISRHQVKIVYDSDQL